MTTFRTPPNSIIFPYTSTGFVQPPPTGLSGTPPTKSIISYLISFVNLFSPMLCAIMLLSAIEESTNGTQAPAGYLARGHHSTSILVSRILSPRTLPSSARTGRRFPVSARYIPTST